MRVKNRDGFMLVQALIGAALMGVLGLAFAGLMKDMWTESQSLQNKSNEISLAHTLRQQVLTDRLCNSSFDVGSRSFSVNDSTRNISIRLDPSQASSTVRAGSNLTNWGLTIDELKLDNISIAMASLGGETLYVGDMRLQATAKNGRKLAYKEKELGKLFLRVRDATNTITGCFMGDSVSGVASAACASLGGVYNTNTGVCDLTNLKGRLLASVGQCPTGQTMAGFDRNGDKICTALPTGPSGPSTPSNYQCSGTKVIGCTKFGASSYDDRPLSANCCPANKISCSKTGGARTGGSCGSRGESRNVYQDFICTCGGV